jgi:hypothetical protein
MIESASKHGGVLTVNWHDRSLAPERLWGVAYDTLLKDLRACQPWFATASKAVSWFRQRRDASFASVVDDAGTLRIQLACARSAPDVPPLRLRIFNRRGASSSGDARGTGAFEEFVIEEPDQVLVAA